MIIMQDFQRVLLLLVLLLFRQMAAASAGGGGNALFTYYETPLDGIGGLGPSQWPSLPIAHNECGGTSEGHSPF